MECEHENLDFLMLSCISHSLTDQLPVILSVTLAMIHILYFSFIYLPSVSMNGMKTDMIYYRSTEFNGDGGEEVLSRFSHFASKKSPHSH